MATIIFLERPLKPGWEQKCPPWGLRRKGLWGDVGAMHWRFGQAKVKRPRRPIPSTAAGISTPAHGKIISFPSLLSVPSSKGGQATHVVTNFLVPFNKAQTELFQQKCQFSQCNSQNNSPGLSGVSWSLRWRVQGEFSALLSSTNHLLWTSQGGRFLPP